METNTHTKGLTMFRETMDSLYLAANPVAAIPLYAVYFVRPVCDSTPRRCPILNLSRCQADTIAADWNALGEVCYVARCN